MDEDCIFCKIINGDIPCTKIYEDKHVLAFLDLFPANFGHTLVIPKSHCQTYSDIPDDQLSSLAIAIKKIAPVLKKAMLAEGYNLMMNNGEVAGQEVHHAHIHIIPRYENDGHKFAAEKKKYKEGEMQQIQKKILEEFKNG